MGLQWKVPEACESLSCLTHPYLRHQTGTNQQRETVDMGADTALRLDYSRLCSSGCRDQFSDHRPIQFARCAP